MIATQWLLHKSPEVVRLLYPPERVVAASSEASGGRGMLLVDRERPMGFNRLYLLVPEGIEVYDPFSYNTRRRADNVFIAVRAGAPNNPAYLSRVAKSPDGSLNFARNAAEFFAYPWYDSEATGQILRKLAEGRTNNLLANFEAYDPTVRGHPLRA